MKVLIVEDDYVSRRLMHIILSPYGACDTAENGREALEAFKEAKNKRDPYDLICLDIMMPEMDGHQVLKEIRCIEQEEQKGDHVKIIMTTALNDPQNIMMSFRQHCEDYLIKPVAKAKLLDKIHHMGLI